RRLSDASTGSTTTERPRPTVERSGAPRRNEVEARPKEQRATARRTANASTPLALRSPNRHKGRRSPNSARSAGEGLALQAVQRFGQLFEVDRAGLGLHVASAVRTDPADAW